jgi:hypothetical protein
MPGSQPPKRLVPDHDLVHISEFARHAGVSPLTVRRWVQTGVLPAYRLPSSTGNPVGRMLRVDLRDLPLVLVRERVDQ